MIQRLSRSAAARPGIIRREHTAYKGDHRQRLLAVITYRIDIPPDIAVLRHGLIEVGKFLGRICFQLILPPVRVSQCCRTPKAAASESSIVVLSIVVDSIVASVYSE